MGKYMRNAKITGDIAVMEVSQTSLGVQTRAKTLALQRLQSSESSYLQLRSRRLEKPPLLDAAKKNPRQEKEDCARNPSSDRSSNARASSRLRSSPVKSGSVGSGLVVVGCEEHGTEGNNDFEIEGSFGENNVEFESRERSTRESTPCSFIRDSDNVGTPGSTTRSRADRRTRNPTLRNIPTTNEMDEFFGLAEQQQQLTLFSEKYNFDFENELPLPGRYEWVGVDL